MEAIDSYEKKYSYYKKLLSLTYRETVQFLLKKHGEVIDNYYKEKSYNSFLDGKIKKITHGKYTKTKEGLYCHHTLENEYENISSTKFIAQYMYPYEYHKKENLVYCDLIEHLILHALITKETNGERGFRGLVTFLIPMVKEWYIDGIEPILIWKQLCRERAYLSKEYTEKLLSDIDNLLKDVDAYKLILEEVRKEELAKEKLEKDIQQMIRQQKTYQEARIKSIMQSLNISREEAEKNEILINRENLLHSYRQSIYNFKADKTLSRAKVLSDYSYFLDLERYRKPIGYVSDKFKSKNINITKENLIKETETIIEKLKSRLKTANYYKLEDIYNSKELNKNQKESIK